MWSESGSRPSPWHTIPMPKKISHNKNTRLQQRSLRQRSVRSVGGTRLSNLRRSFLYNPLGRPTPAVKLTLRATKSQLIFSKSQMLRYSNAGSSAVSTRIANERPPHTRRRRSLLQGSREGPLPPLPEGFGPWGPMWNDSIAFCTVIRDENITDVREWLQYHKWLGVDHIYLTENHSATPILDAINDYINSGFVTYNTIDEPHAQLQVYSHCVRNYRTHYNWLAFFDADEYLVLRNGNTLKPLLNDYRYFPGLAVHWIFVGANNRLTRPESGGVMRHYTSCWPQPNGHVKVIANSYFVRDTAQHPHNMFYRGGATAVNEGKHPIPLKVLDKCMPGGSCQLTPGHEERNPLLKSAHRIALFHFVTKSREDFEIKAKRGGGNNHSGKSMSFFDTIQRGSGDHPICHELQQVADTCCPVA